MAIFVLLFRMPTFLCRVVYEKDPGVQRQCSMESALGPLFSVLQADVTRITQRVCAMGRADRCRGAAAIATKPLRPLPWTCGHFVLARL